MTIKNNNKLCRFIDKCVVESVKKEMCMQRIKKILREEFIKLNEDDGQSTDMKRNAVMKTLKDPKFNHAQLAYDLYHPKDQSEKDTVRSLFSKKATGNPDNDGAVRSFSDDEINKLYQMVRKR